LFCSDTNKDVTPRNGGTEVCYLASPFIKGWKAKQKSKQSQIKINHEKYITHPQHREINKYIRQNKIQ